MCLDQIKSERLKRSWIALTKNGLIKWISDAKNTVLVRFKKNIKTENRNPLNYPLFLLPKLLIYDTVF